MARATHPKKEVEEALRHAEGNGWHVKVGGSHAWGKIYCPYNVTSAALPGLAALFIPRTVRAKEGGLPEGYWDEVNERRAGTALLSWEVIKTNHTAKRPAHAANCSRHRHHRAAS